MTDKPFVFLEISIDGVKIPGQIKLELFDKEAPMTAANFRQLCTGGADIGCYKGSSFHRAIPGFMCCGGDFIRGDGTGVGSIYGDKFPVVERSDPHRYRSSLYNGLLVTGHAVPVAQAPYTCGPKFILTSLITHWLADTHTIFGGIVGGVDIVKHIQDAGTPSGTIPKKVMIHDCGELPSASVWGAAPRRQSSPSVRPAAPGQSSPSVRPAAPRQSSPSVRPAAPRQSSPPVWRGAAPGQSSPPVWRGAAPGQGSPSVRGATPRRR